MRPEWRVNCSKRGGGTVFTLLSRIFIKDADAVDRPEVREKYGVLAGVLGIFLNLALFAGKLAIGLLSGAVSIISDAFNNLSDAFSNIVSITGFRIASRRADEGHPFGHGRVEYVSGLIVGLVVVMIGLELFNTSIGRIRAPRAPEVGLPVFLVLALSIAVKLYMFAYNRALSAKINSVVLKSVAIDSISDVAATSVVLISTLVYYAKGINLDGWSSLFVSIFIMVQGVRAVKETVDPLLGNAPDPDLVDRISATVKEYEGRGVAGIHDIVVHDYGPGRHMITAHVEMPGDLPLSEVHKVCDAIERRLKGEYGVEAVIHMDPVSDDDPFTVDLKEKLLKFADGLQKDISVHDLQVTKDRSGRTDIDFDVALPFADHESDEEIVRIFKAFVGGVAPGSHCRINVDRR